MENEESRFNKIYGKEIMHKKKVKQEEKTKGRRVSGDLLFYFCLHNLISVLLFFLFTINLGIYAGHDLMLIDIIRQEFWELAILKVFPISILCSFLGRIGAYYILKLQVKIRDRNRKIKGTTKKWSELNSKMNRLGLPFFIGALISSIIYTLGMVGILQYVIFNEKSLLSLIVVYIGIKIGTYYFVQWFIGSKLG